MTADCLYWQLLISAEVPERSFEFKSWLGPYCSRGFLLCIFHQVSDVGVLSFWSIPVADVLSQMFGTVGLDWFQSYFAGLLCKLSWKRFKMLLPSGMQ